MLSKIWVHPLPLSIRGKIMSALLSFDPALSLGLRGAVVLILMAAASHKLHNWQGFKAAVAGYEILPSALIPSAAIFMVVSEIVIAGGLILFPLTIVPALLAAGIFVLYGAAMALALVRGKQSFDCGCGGLSKSQDVSWSLVTRNGVIAAVVLFLATPMAFSHFVWVDWGTALFVAAFGALLFAAADTLLDNRMQIKAAEAGR